MKNHSINIGFTILLAIVFAVCSTTLSSAADVQKWTEDIDFIVETVLNTHPDPFFRASEEEFFAAVKRIKDQLADLSDEQITLELMKLVAMLKDGHSSLWPYSPDTFTTWLPWRTYHFPEGLFVTALPKEHVELIGSRVLRIGNMSAEEAFEKVQEIVAADNAYSRRERAHYHFANASMLKALGISDSADSLTVVLEAPDGNERTLELGKIKGNLHGSWYFRQDRGPQPDACASVLTVLADDKPFHLDYRDKAYWFEYLTEHKAVYMQFSAVQDLGDESFADFWHRMFAYIDEHSVEKLIIDIRYNGGGNGDMLWPFIYEIIKRDSINTRGNLFVIIGPKTFSAATMAACRLKNHTNAMLVGEPIGSGMNHYGDAGGFELPNSGLRFRVSTLYWQEGHPADRRDILPPDYPGVMTAKAYFSGSDPSLEAILNGEVRLLEDIVMGEGLDAGIAWYEAKKKEFAGVDWWIPFTERGANNFGYRLLGNGDMQGAIKVFALNAETFPDSWNVWDSLGEAHMKAGNREEAIRCYRKSLEINPGNENGRDILMRLEQEK